MVAAQRSSTIDCWICHDPANSGEHRVKRAALKAIFKKPINQCNPLHFRTEADRKFIGSTKADILKFPKNICIPCNTTRTQPHDRAWQHFFEMIHKDCSPLRPGDKINLWKVFPDSPTLGMIDVQLYFAKLMGCTIAASGEHFDLTSLSSAILENSPHPHLYLKFATMLNGPPHVGQSELSMDGTSAAFIHTIGTLSVVVLHAPDGEDRVGKVGAWHPRVLSDHLYIHLI